MNKRKLLQKILTSQKNVRFQDVVVLVEAFGFRLARTAGSHHIFVHPGIPELVTFRMSRNRPNLIRYARSYGWSNAIT